MKKEGTPVTYVLLHNIRSVFNVGSMFRTADALGIDTIYLSGHTPTPLDRFNNKRKDFAKVALGAEESVTWKYFAEPYSLIDELKQGGVDVIAVEQGTHSVDYKSVRITKPTIFIFGNEVEGVEKALLDKADVIAEIPMAGTKESLNVSVSFGIALFRMLDR